MIQSDFAIFKNTNHGFGEMYCAECGFPLKREKSLYTKAHLKQHQQWETLCGKYGRIRTCPGQIEDDKSAAWDRQSKWEKRFKNASDKASKDEALAHLVQESENILRCFFERSIDGERYEKAMKHVQFPEYAALILNAEEHWKERFGEEPYKILVKKYGKKKGMQDGYTYGGRGSESRFVH